MANVDELCGKMVLLKTLFDEMYQSGGLISVQGGDNGIHVTTEFLHRSPGSCKSGAGKTAKPTLGRFQKRTTVLDSIQ